MDLISCRQDERTIDITVWIVLSFSVSFLMSSKVIMDRGVDVVASKLTYCSATLTFSDV